MSKSENVALYKYLTRPARPELPEASVERQMYQLGSRRIPVTPEQEAEALRRFGIPFDQLDVQKRSRIRKGYYSDPDQIRIAKPATKAQEEIAQKVYGKSFIELDSDRRTKIRTGKITMKSSGVNLMNLAERIAYTQNRMKNFVSEFEKERGRLPSRQEIRKLGGFEIGTVNKYINQGIIQAGERGATRGLKDPRVVEVNNQLKFLDNNKYIQDSFKKGQVPNINEVAKILNIKDKSIAGYRVGQLASTYMGDRKVEGIKPKFKKGAEFIFQQADAEYNPAIRKLSELKIGRSVGEKSIATTKSGIKRAYPEGISESYAIDEPAGTVSSARRGTSPYGAFGQIINSELNKGIKYEFDRKKSILERQLQDAIESGSDTEIKSTVKKFNDTVSEYEKKLNVDVKPGQKRIKLFKVSLDNPENTIANYSELSDSYKDALQKNYKTRGYAFKIPSDIKPLTQIADELKIEKNVAKLSGSAAKGAPRIYSQFLPFAKETGEFISETFQDLATKGSRVKGLMKFLGGAGAAYGIYDTGVAFQEGKSVPEMAFRFVGADPIYNMIKEYNRLPKEAQAIQKKINAQESFDAAQQDAMDEGLVGLTGRPDVTDQEKIYLDEQKKIAREKMQAEDAARAEGRMGPINMIQQKMFEVTGQPYSVSFANGGRVFLKEGGKPVNIGRRKFLKATGQGLTVLAALPFLGKFIKPATKAAPEVMEVITRSADQMPTYLGNLINKIKMMGTSKIIGKMDSPDEFIRYDLGDYELFEGAGGARLKRVRDRGEFGYEEFEMQIKKDPETDFIEYEEVSVRPDPDGKMKDVDFGIDDDIHAEMKKFADED